MKSVSIRPIPGLCRTIASQKVRLLAGLLLMLYAAAAQVQAGEYADGILWRIERGDSKPSYLFGTVHMDDPRVLDLPAPVEQSLRVSRHFVMEVEMDSAAVAASNRAMLFQDGSSLADHLDADRMQQVVELMAERGIPREVVMAFKPWAVSTLLSLPPLNTGEFLDLALMNRARRADKPVSALETIEEQLATLSGFTLDEQVQMLHDTLDHIDELPAIQGELLEAYLARDLKTLMSVSEKSMGVDEADRLAEKFWDALVVQRNQRMFERMLPLLDEGGAFVAVGALHLPGENGLLNLLERKKFKLEAIY